MYKFKEGDKVKIITGHGRFNNLIGSVYQIKDVPVLDQVKTIYLIIGEGLSGAFQIKETCQTCGACKKELIPNARTVFEEEIELVNG